MERYSPDKKTMMLSREQVRAFDSWAINTLDIPGVVLMENAGRSCAELVKEKLSDIKKPRVCIFCGTGNNGGDGYVIARHLLNDGFKVTVVLCGRSDKVKGDAKTNLNILERLGYLIEQLNIDESDIRAKVSAFTTGADMIVDAIFGTGLTGQLSEQHRQLIESINIQDCPILAVDIPSGLDCDTGETLSVAIRAKYTVTFVAVKKGFASASAAQHTGEIYIASIGVEPARWLSETDHRKNMRFFKEEPRP